MATTILIQARVLLTVRYHYGSQRRSQTTSYSDVPFSIMILARDPWEACFLLYPNIRWGLSSTVSSSALRRSRSSQPRDRRAQELRVNSRDAASRVKLD